MKKTQCAEIPLWRDEIFAGRVISHCDPARGGGSRLLRAANGGEAKGGCCKPG